MHQPKVVQLDNSVLWLWAKSQVRTPSDESSASLAGGWPFSAAPPCCLGNTHTKRHTSTYTYVNLYICVFIFSWSLYVNVQLCVCVQIHSTDRKGHSKLNFRMEKRKDHLVFLYIYIILFTGCNTHVLFCKIKILKNKTKTIFKKYTYYL